VLFLQRVNLKVLQKHKKVAAFRWETGKHCDQSEASDIKHRCKNWMKVARW